MFSRISASTLCVLAIACASCETKRGTGTAVGAAGGGLVGAALGGTSGLIVGAAIGGLLGYTAGREMEEEDRRRAAYALERDRQEQWTNTSTGAHYVLVPMQTTVDNGRTCRTFRIDAESGGDREQVNGVACRHTDGRWELVGG